MAGITDFITQASSELGISQDSAKSGAGALLGMLQKTAGTEEFAEVTQVMPDADEAMKAAPAAEDGGGLGGMLSQAAGALGGGKGLDVAAALGKAGIPLDQIGPFVQKFIAFLKAKLPANLAETLLSKVGDLTKLLG